MTHFGTPAQTASVGKHELHALEEMSSTSDRNGIRDHSLSLFYGLISKGSLLQCNNNNNDNEILTKCELLVYTRAQHVAEKNTRLTQV